MQHFIQLPILDSSIVIAVAILVGGIGMSFPLGLLVDRWGRRPVALLAVVAISIGLALFSLARSLPALMLTGILWLAAYTAWSITTAAWTKDLYPEDKRGQFAGYYILFNVAFTMIPGPLLGGWLASTYGIATVIDGKPGTIPTPILFQAAALAVLFALIPLLLIKKPAKNPEKLTEPAGIAISNKKR
jgi:MFS family permease